jgi:lipoyl(octanoyl) transferase
MALDAALMERVRAGASPTLRFYRWSPACLSLGRNQPARGCYEPGAIHARGLEVVRRPTGGRAVLHGRELTYSVVLPDRLLGGPRQCYATVNRALLRGLLLLGVPAVLQPRGVGSATIPPLVFCFPEPTEGEVVLGGRKLVGSAQCRERGVLLQHGSLLLEDDQADVGALLRDPPPPPAEERAATLADALDPLPTWDALVEALLQGWQAELGARPTEADPAEHAPPPGMIGRYKDPAWTWRY